MLNKAILQGRLVADPELRYTRTGTAVVSFRIACDRPKSKSPNAQNADFINIVAWRQTAAFISRYFTKGSLILVDGRVQVRDYTDHSGNKRYTTEIVAENVNFCGKNQNNGNSTQQEYTAYQQNSYIQPTGNEFSELLDDGELPY